MKTSLDIIKKYWLLIILILQPILDIVAYFNFNTYITPVSFIFRTLILIFIILYTFVQSKSKKKYILCMIPFIIISILHIINSYRVGYLSLFDDVRYLIIVMQMPILTIAFINYISEHKNYLIQLKIGMIINLFIIFLSFILSIIFNNYKYTYEGYGITGWFTSPNTQSMILLVIVPLACYFLSRSKRISIYIFSILIPFVLLFFNGTRACYFTLIITLLILLNSSIFSEKSKDRIIRSVISILSILLLILLNNYSFTAKRNIMMLSNEEELKEKIKLNYNYENLKNIPKDKIIEILNDNYYWRELMEIYGPTTVYNKIKNHLNEKDLLDNRYRKRVYGQIIYDQSDFYTKFVGFEFTNIGNLKMDLENDFTAIFYYYGYIGFSLYILFIIYFILILIKLFLKNKKIIFDGEYVLYFSILLLCILGAEYAGALLRKSNANIYFSVLLTLIYFKSKTISTKTVLNKNKITFLLLHLGYGGIESSTINTSNELSKKYNIELISFYKLKNSQEDKLSNNITIKYLYNGGPNREELYNAIKSKNIFKILKNTFLAIRILILKQYLLINEIQNSDSFVIVSTRNEFSVLLSRYGKDDAIKIAQEHQHHNSNKKYINNIKYKFSNINYLFALTTSLKSDYEKFLANNNKIKVILVPNMIYRSNMIVNVIDNDNIITISRLHKGKKIDELINIFSKIDNKKNYLYIIGDGEELNKLKSIIKKRKLSKRIILTGYLDKEQMKKYLGKCCLFAMTSISEGLPMVLLESMSCGIPCIAYKTDSGVTDIIDDKKNGYIIENRNELEYINKINEFLKDRKLREKMSKEAFKKSKKFEANQIIKIWEGVINEKK